MDLGPPQPVLGPVFRKIKGPVEQHAAVPARIAQEHADLAVLDPAGGPCTLSRDAGRLLAFLQKTGLVEHQDGIGIAELFDNIGLQVVPHSVGVPPRARQKLLDTIRRAVAGRFGQLPAVLALDRRQQAAKIGSRSTARLRSPETRRDAIHNIVQTRQPVGNISAHRHGRDPSSPITHKPDFSTRESRCSTAQRRISTKFSALASLPERTVSSTLGSGQTTCYNWNKSRSAAKWSRNDEPATPERPPTSRRLLRVTSQPSPTIITSNQRRD